MNARVSAGLCVYVPPKSSKTKALLHQLLPCTVTLHLKIHYVDLGGACRNSWDFKKSKELLTVVMLLQSLPDAMHKGKGYQCIEVVSR